MKIKIASTISIRQSWLDEVIAFVPGVVFEVVRTKELITTHYRPEWKSQYGNFADVRRIVNATDVYARVYIMSHGQLRRLGITNHLALYDNADRDGILDTYISLDSKLDARAKANGFNSNFAWLIVHELTHGREQNIGREYLAVDGDRTHDWEAQGRLKELWATTSLIEVLKAKVTKLMAMLKLTTTPMKTLYQTCLDNLGIDVSPRDLAPDDLGCAETASNLIRKVLPDFPIILGTYTLWEKLENDKRFKKVTIPMPGTIIISPTGSARAKIPGHVGFCGVGDKIMSNSSATGLFVQNYTQATWRGRWVKAGYPIYYYQHII